MFLDRYPVACVLQPRMFDPLSPLKSTLVIHSRNPLSTLFHDKSTLASYNSCLRINHNLALLKGTIYEY